MDIGVRVLVATAEPLLGDGIVNAVTAAGDLEVVGKPKDRAEAIRVIRELQPGTCCVAIIDFDLFGPDALQAIEEIKRDAQNLGVLALVSGITPSRLLQSLQVGITGYLLKTATSDEVINAIRSVCAGEAVLGLQSFRELVQYMDHGVGKQGHARKGQRLGQKELEVLKLASRGLTNKKIAQRLFISERTVQSHFSNIFTRLGVASRTEAVVAAWRNGWITNEDLVD
jgi:DNA-binding NarL/FixJ family response regulator